MLATNDRVVTALVDGMHLESYRTVNPINRCPQTLVPPQAVKKFRAKYVSLHALAGQRKVHIATMKSRLEALRIEPAFDPKKISARFYLRKDVEDHARRRPGE